MTTRVGFGYDVHAFSVDASYAPDTASTLDIPGTPKRPLVLGGVVIPHPRGLSGHSDADTVIHALVDALLGAAALGDIGQHFPSSDPRWKDQPSAVFLDYTHALLQQHGWRIGNIDATIVAERPKLAPYIPAMRAHLAEHLHLEVAQVSVKATTTDGLGFTGRQEGIACYAVALIEQ